MYPVYNVILVYNGPENNSIDNIWDYAGGMLWVISTFYTDS